MDLADFEDLDVRSFRTSLLNDRVGKLLAFDAMEFETEGVLYFIAFGALDL